MRQFLSNDQPMRSSDIDQIKDLLGLDDKFLSVEEAADAAVEAMVATARKRRDEEAKIARNTELTNARITD